LHDEKWEALDTKLLEKENLARAQSCYGHGTVMVAERQDIDLTARAAIVIDDLTGEILFSKNENDQQAIASMTKIMTALVFLDNNPGWKKMIQIQKADNVGGVELNIKVGDKLSARDVFLATLIGSKNNMAMALARSTGLSVNQFVAAMNKKALEFGANNTKFVEPTGLNSANVSTAEDMAKIMRQAFKSPKMLEATTLKNYWVKTATGKKYLVTNTNKLLSTDLYITGGKTGHTDEAGYCLGTKARLNGRDVLAVVLGAAPERNYKEVYYLLKKFGVQT
ncbi:D-alanyl-D-alanine carboxypeptidase, partial [Candidatus Falkowbacteria bacterium]|nr:D-alanyl-D-alanine carboxypeptidase [Candidatus Falkowbacteria bacterium]